MAKCNECNQDHFGIFDIKGGLCRECREKLASDRERLVPNGKMSPEIKKILVTTESSPSFPIAERLDIVTAEVVIGMHLFKDLTSAFTDTFGGRSKAMQSGLRDARVTALTELRLEAHAIGADAVIAVDLDYSEISGGGKSMLFLVASGTAVRLAN